MFIEKIYEGGFKNAMMGCRLSHQSTEKCDSKSTHLGKGDYTLAMKLIPLGDSHSKFLRAINITFNINAPLHWYKQLDTYKIGTTALSDSTMHNISKLDRFTQEHFETNLPPIVLNTLNEMLYSYKRTRDIGVWYELIGLLPSSFLQERYWFANYQVIRNIYRQRHRHKLFCWQHFCEECLNQLNYPEFLTI
jgi:hypothetical protein